MLLRLMPAGNEALAFGSEAATTILEDDGTFTFFNVPAGRYTAARADRRDRCHDRKHDDADCPMPLDFPVSIAGFGSISGAPSLSYLAKRGAPAPSWGRMPVNVGACNVDQSRLPNAGGWQGERQNCLRRRRRRPAQHNA
jgi:hypothetical protein